MTQRYIGGLIYNPPGGYSGYFDGSGDYLSVADATALNVSTGDFTLECWAFPTSSSTYQVVFAKGGVANTDVQGISLSISGGTFVGLCRGSGAQAAITSSAFALSTWNHLVLVRSGTTLALFVNGVRAGTQTNSNDASNTRIVSIGTAYDASLPFTGYVSNARLVKGTAVYDPTQTSITVPNGPLQNITNTSLLTCRYPTFVDGSNNAFTITVNGNTTVSTQNPFPLTTLPNPAQGGAGNGIFSMSQYQSLKQQNLWPAIDPYFDYTTLLLHGNGTNGGQNNTFLDSGTANSGSGFTITRNGNTTQGTFSPFSQTGWSNYFGSGGASYLIANATDTSKFAFGTGDFTIEFWVYAEALTAPDGLVTFYDQRAASTDGVCPTIYYYSGQLLVYVQATNVIYGSSLSLNQWTHIALSRVSGNSRLFVNGVQTGSTYSDSNNYVAPSSNIRIFANCYGGSRSPTGYCSNFRVVKGTGLYSANFTPPTSPLTAITNTQLLTCQSNRFVDNSSNALTVTPYNTYSVQAFSPFAPTAAYSASTVGGSGYFDGSGDYLSVANNTALQLGSSDWDIECWVYLTTTISGAQRIISQADSNYEFAYYLSNMALTAYSFQSGGTQNFAISMGTLTTGQWYHLATTRSGSNIRSFINGTQVGTATFSGTIDARTGGWNFGASYAPSEYLNGYISSARIVKGSAVYTSAFTPPTAPLTNITNTSLLLNFTNAAIIDNTAKNVLETVGNAQISTTQSKFGGASMYFDGTGDWLTSPATVNTSFGTGNFTVECWIYSTVNQNNNLIVSNRVTAVDTAWSLEFYNNGTGNNILNWHSGTTIIMYANTAANTNTWNHVAVVRSGTTTKIYLNGTEVASATDSRNYSYVGPVQVGYEALAGTSGIGYYNGYIDDLRITKGIARYTSNFTPQTSQWQDQ